MFKRGEDAFLVLELRVRECERRIAKSDGQTKALEYAMRAVIASASNPSALRAAWAQLIPMIVQGHTHERGEAASDYLDGLRQGLQFVTEQIDAAAERPCPPRR
ncbi:hypothetical protein QEG32_002100 [Stenotrophomonas maltophilia]|nr:hypothetical protein [Stenotrophomonas maltophilia]